MRWKETFYYNVFAFTCITLHSLTKLLQNSLAKLLRVNAKLDNMRLERKRSVCFHEHTQNWGNAIICKKMQNVVSKCKVSCGNAKF